ncbi:MAG: glucosyl transferase [Yersiniaceae bacterium]|nr:glucosyl transferase [Yersiniaceae bacterium]
MYQKKERNWILGLFILSLTYFLLFLRRPDILTNAQFWAEDGVIWYKNAYESGVLKSIFYPQNGYYQTISKIVGGLSIFTPIAYAPLLTNALGILIRAAVVWFFLSKRFDFLSLIPRVFVALYFVLMPYTDEVHANITNVHWFLALYSLMILMANKSESILWRSHDVIILFISSVSGPFSVFLLPCLALKYLSIEGFSDIFNINKIIKFFKSSHHTIILIGAIIQIIAILTSSESSRSSAPLGADLLVLSNIISSRVVVSTLATENISLLFWDTPLLSVLTSFVFLSGVILVIKTRDWRPISLLLLSTLIVGFSLAKPMISLTEPQWPILRSYLADQRYFVLPHITIFTLIALLSFKACKSIYAKAVHIFIFSITIVFLIIKFFTITPLPDQHWKESARRFNIASPGDVVIMPITPPGWAIKITKKE